MLIRDHTMTSALAFMKSMSSTLLVPKIATLALMMWFGWALSKGTLMSGDVKKALMDREGSINNATARVLFGREIIIKYH